MKTNLDQFLVDLTPQDAIVINGGRRGRGKDDGPGHRREVSRRGRGQDDGPGHR